MATGYKNAFITLSPDCPVAAGHMPRQSTSIAGLEHALLSERPYYFNAEDLILQAHRLHKGVSDADVEAFSVFLFTRSQPCMRLSMLPKRWSWGVHYDEQGRKALYGAETRQYRHIATRSDLRVIATRPMRRLIGSRKHIAWG